LRRKQKNVVDEQVVKLKQKLKAQKEAQENAKAQQSKIKDDNGLEALSRFM
jgi:hypothetical protein